MANSRPLSVDVPVTAEEVSHNRRMLLEAAHQALDLWFENLERVPLREIDQLPSLVWIKNHALMAVTARVEGTVYERAPMDAHETLELFGWMHNQAYREGYRQRGR